MATHPADFGRASALPLSVALALIPSLQRPMLARFVARAIERLNDLDGDPDLEDGDEDLGHDEGEPDFRRPHWRLRKWAGPGCQISDSDYCSAGDN